jgi:hypothetical protein
MAFMALGGILLKPFPKAYVLKPFLQILQAPPPFHQKGQQLVSQKLLASTAWHDWASMGSFQLSTVEHGLFSLLWCQKTFPIFSTFSNISKKRPNFI